MRPPELIQMASEGRLDIIISVEPSVTATAGFQGKELRRLSLVLVMREDHPLARLKRIPTKRLRDLPLVGLAPTAYPGYVPHIRSILKPFGFRPKFIALETDGVMTLFTKTEAYKAAATLANGVFGFMPPPERRSCTSIAPAAGSLQAKNGGVPCPTGQHVSAAKQEGCFSRCGSLRCRRDASR